MMQSSAETLSRPGQGHVRDNTVDTLALDSLVDRHPGTEESGPISLLSKRGGSLRKKQRSGSSDDRQKRKRFLGLFSMDSKSKAAGHKEMASEPLVRTDMFAEERLGERGEYEVSSPVSDDRLAERDDCGGCCGWCEGIDLATREGSQGSNSCVQVDDRMMKAVIMGRSTSPIRFARLVPQ